MRNWARFRSCKDYYMSIDRSTVPEKLARIRKYCEEKGIKFPPSRSDMELLKEDIDEASSIPPQPGVLQTIFNRIAQFLSPIFNVRLRDAVTWARRQLGIRPSSVGVQPLQPEMEMETVKVTLQLPSDDAAGGESLGIIGPDTANKNDCHQNEQRFLGKFARPSCYKLPNAGDDELDEVKICHTHNYAPLCTQ